MQHNGITDADIQILDECRIVQRSTLNTGSGKLYRVKLRYRSDAVLTGL